MKRKIENSIQELAHVLSEEISLYEKYKVHLQADREYMTNLKVDELELSNKSKATLLLKIQMLEQARTQVTSKIAKEKGIPEEGLRVQDLCKSLGSEESNLLLSLRTRLLSAVDEIRAIQNECKLLAQSSLTWIDGSMQQLRALLSPVGTYNAQGRVGGSSTFSGHVVENKV